MDLLAGRQGLIFGVANERSYAWHIAKALEGHGARCGFQHLPGEKNRARTRLAVESLEVARDPWIFPCDATREEDLDAIFAAWERDWGRLDFVVHSIAFADKRYLVPGTFVETPREAWDLALGVSAYSLVAIARRARDLMADGGSILAMTYYGAEKVVPGYNVMGVAKAALECATRYLAAELGERAIRVNAISGGPLRTLSAMGIRNFRSILGHTAKRAPLGRNVEGRDVGGTAVFLVSDLSAGITGEVFHVDCGASIMAG